MTDAIVADPLPIERASVFSLPQGLEELAAVGPVHRIAYPDGIDGWLVTSREIAEAALADARLVIAEDTYHPAPPRAGSLPVHPETDALWEAMRKGFFLTINPPDHMRFRRALSSHFSPKRILELEDEITVVVEEHLDRLEAAGRGADLVAEFALPVPLTIIGRVLGVQPNPAWRALSHLDTTDDSTPDDYREAMNGLLTEMQHEVSEKRREPTDDILSRLATSTDLDFDEAVGAGVILVVAGHNTTANMFGLATLLLLDHRPEWDAARGNPETARVAVEEILRYITVFQLGAITRIATTDLEIGALRMSAGERVHVSLPAANRDPMAFPLPGVLDLVRDTTGHLAFGYGIHQCLGQHLARLELRIGLTRLFERFPGLRLAEPAADVRVNPSNVDMHGLRRLLVTW
jgi:cytochrome P450